MAVPRRERSAKGGQVPGTAPWSVFVAKHMGWCPGYVGTAVLIPEAALALLYGFGIEVSTAFGI